jgi:uncharacterized membrane protein
MMDDELAGDPDGFREGERALPFEGEDMGRILGLSDGIFSFAMTLLVLSLVVPSTTTLPLPNLNHYLGGLTDAFIAYVVGFLIIGSFWVAHHRLFRHIRKWDTVLLWLNILLLLTVAVDPFIIGLYMTYGPRFDDIATAAGVWASTGALLAAIWVYATYHRRLVDAKLSDQYVTRYLHLLEINPVFFAASIGVAVVAPAAAEYLWITGIVVQAVARRHLAGHQSGRGRRGAPARAAHDRPLSAAKPPDA